MLIPNKKEIKIIKKRVPIHRDSFFYNSLENSIIH